MDASIELPGDTIAGDLGDASIIAGFFAEAFERDSVGVDDDFFELGGDSLMAAAVMTAIEQRFGPVFPISALFEAPTPRTLAGMLNPAGAGYDTRVLLKINPQGSSPPLFCVHGSDGESVLPSRLSQAVGDRALYAFRAIGLEGGERPNASVEAMADAYFEAVLSTCPSGPFFVLGHCAGCLVAYELAQRLHASGRTPAGLVLMDPPAHRDQLHLHLFGREREFRRAIIAKWIAEIDAQFANGRLTGTKRRELMKDLIERAAAVYIPKPYPGPTLLFVTPSRASVLLSQTGYPTLLPDLEIARLDEEHTQMFKDLGVMAKAINSFIERRI